MKSKELIRKLLKADPTGEAEICVGNSDIIDVGHMEPCYYDGNFYQIITDSKFIDDYNFWGIKKIISRSSGSKINLLSVGPKEAFEDNPEAEFESEGDLSRREYETIEIWRKEGKKAYKEFEAASPTRVINNNVMDLLYY